MQAINDRRQPRPGSAVPGPIGLLLRVVVGAVAVYALVELVTKLAAWVYAGRLKMLGEIEPPPAQVQAVRAGPGWNQPETTGSA